MSSLGPSEPQVASARRPAHRTAIGASKEIAIILGEAGGRWVDDACYRMAASLAYYALFSIFPLLLVSVTVLGFFLGNDPASRDEIVASTSRVLSPQFRSLLDDTLSSMQSHE